uniref:NBS-LRR class resistance protein n=1 Tax=Secale cereale TaxID=4550 RepID=A0A7D3UBF1_SECCE|nr:NBS-LRR class resistance protein [Secale cereale]
MADPVTIGAAVGWGVSAVGWLASPIISRVLNKGFALLDSDATEKLKILDIQIIQLQRVMEVVDESTYRIRLEPLLDKLKSALYEAEDILDAIEYQRLKKQIQDTNKVDSLKKTVQSAMSYPKKDKKSGMSKVELKESIENIESAISDACKVLEQLNLLGVSNDNGGRATATNSRSAVTTAGPPTRVIGRDQDRDKIIAMLNENEDQCQTNLVNGGGRASAGPFWARVRAFQKILRAYVLYWFSGIIAWFYSSEPTELGFAMDDPPPLSGTCYSVIGIHGIAGSGKSTLAQYVYEHEKKYRQEKMEGHFDIVMWIHVSQKFDVDSIFREMFEGATGKACDNFNSRNVLKEKLEDELRGKKIFLVLDDVWYNIKNSGDREELQKLISPLNVGKTGSKILVTSRTEAALCTLGAVKERCIKISDLDDKVFLEMLMHYALRDARVSEHDQRILEMIGEDIAKKLKGSPLAARTVGSRLRETQTVEFWRSQKDRDLLNDTMGALWWSYQYLDEQVRRCFAYCSIFPRRHRLKRDELVKLWVAEGFIKTSKAEEEMEDVAKNYFDELLSASFLQLGGKDKLFEREVDYFTIHDLLCDLAEEVAGRDCFRIEKGYTGEVPKDVRYLFVGTYDREMLTKKISGLQNLRTLIIDAHIEVKSNECQVFASMFSMFMGLRKLRVLNLCLIETGRCTFSFPDSIGQLKHLRYFLFWVTALTRLTVPAAFMKLYHMQVVDFGGCQDLAFSSGEDMMSLVNLRCVMSGADLDFPDVGRLIWLQMLPFFTIRKKKGYEPHQLKHLNKLQGTLYICGLENVESKEEALEVNLAAKEKLTELVLQWKRGSCSPEVQADVVEGLCPSKYLETLEIRNYLASGLPNWIVGCIVLPKDLQELTFRDCGHLGPAGDLGAFIYLHSLCLVECRWDALPGNMDHLTSLKKLEITVCMNIRSLPTLPMSLEEFTLMYCNLEFMRSCTTAADPNWQKIEHIPKKTIICS